MPPAAALLCDRTGCTLLMIATVAPALAAARAARCPASPAPMMRTSCEGMSRKPTSRSAAEDACPGRGVIHGTAYDARQMATSDPVRVMVVDDQADVRFLLGLIFRDHADIELVAEANGAEAALAALGPSAPDVALLDARMPVTDGFELAPMLLAEAPALRIALLTALVDEVVEERAREAGAAICVSKADFELLPDLVRSLARR